MPANIGTSLEHFSTCILLSDIENHILSPKPYLAIFGCMRRYGYVKNYNFRLLVIFVVKQIILKLRKVKKKF